MLMAGEPGYEQKIPQINIQLPPEKEDKVDYTTEIILAAVPVVVGFFLTVFWKRIRRLFKS